MQQMLEQRILDAFPGATVSVAVDGNRAEVNVVSDAFVGMNRVKRQQAVYACLNDLIADGSLHAVTIKALDA